LRTDGISQREIGIFSQTNLDQNQARFFDGQESNCLKVRVERQNFECPQSQAIDEQADLRRMAAVELKCTRYLSTVRPMTRGKQRIDPIQSNKELMLSRTYLSERGSVLHSAHQKRTSRQRWENADIRSGTTSILHLSRVRCD
jgi:hypothetical protein